MNNSIINFPLPANEPVKAYMEGSPERVALEKELERQSKMVVEIPIIIGGKEIRTGDMGEVTCPHDHKHVIARYHKVGKKEVEMAVEAAMKAWKQWSRTPWTTRAAIVMKMAELLATKYRPIMNAATMLGQSKNFYQAEIDSACETIDFFRYNVHYASKIYAMQPKDGNGQLNHTEYRPLEGFILAVTPFNFTSIASNLCMTPVLMGNVALWKPSTTALLSNYYLMQLYKEAGLPDGVVNFLPGSGALIGEVATSSKYFSGIHFTGSTATFQSLWKQASMNVDKYISYPRLVGETGGKDFIFVHPSADPKAVATAAFCGAYEFQGQKCSAASRMYIPKSLWAGVLEDMKAMAAEVKMGDVMDPKNFINAVIDKASFDKAKSYIDYANDAKDAQVVMGGKCDCSKGWFVEPTVIETSNPHFKSMEEEIFAPVLTVYPYDDEKWEEIAGICNETSPYGLTGAVFGRDRMAVEKITEILSYAAGNFYINDKPTGAVVGMQPFGGARASGTNDKAGGEFNLIRWIIPRVIKETLVSPTDYRYTYMK
ncbi:MAG: L-glutamate gamma-semialdehyde dehydrogenase [Muribaculaceae bacterium]|nr:L-glutamate gamma-semialdehyde dehydrogenase [Muribaculaceae bacterium]MBQ2562843.1 L-glutamate gamma-semialdehyde dehydrogenase [Muribaculaceae bacterium]MDY6292938.1 L-glutamate gamma-semialdehyde dehydrogenase [Bacteroidales bacterium]MDY6412513.1 L-glutamate gamma-semialdehyde dehydrogenase [Bacteroidales bacterium]